MRSRPASISTASTCGPQARSHAAHHARPAQLRSLAAVLLASVAVSACATGERPVLIEPATVVDPGAADVVSLLERATSGTFTAEYTVTPTLAGSSPAVVTVAHTGSRTKVSVGDIAFFTDGTVARTCNAGTCTDGVADALVSNLGITNTFWSQSAIAKLQLDAARSINTTRTSTASIAGQAATCADVSVPSVEGVGIVVYCALQSGPLARYTGADTTVELTSFVASVDETQLGP